MATKKRKRDRPWKGRFCNLPLNPDRMPDSDRYQPWPAPIAFMRYAHHHTTRARSKAERYIDRYWFTYEDDTAEGRRANRKNVAPRKTLIFPLSLPAGRPAKKPVTERECIFCKKPYLAKRRGAKFCSPKCRKAAERRRNLKAA